MRIADQVKERYAKVFFLLEIRSISVLKVLKSDKYGNDPIGIMGMDGIKIVASIYVKKLLTR